MFIAGIKIFFGFVAGGILLSLLGGVIGGLYAVVQAVREAKVAQ